LNLKLTSESILLFIEFSEAASAYGQVPGFTIKQDW